MKQDRTMFVRRKYVVNALMKLAQDFYGVKINLMLYLRFVGMVCVVTRIRNRSEIGCN